MNSRQKLSLFHQLFCSSLTKVNIGEERETVRYNFDALGKENPIIDRLSDQEVDLILSIFSQISHESYIDEFQRLIETIFQRKLISVKSIEYSPEWITSIDAQNQKDTFIVAPANILKLFEQLHIPICINMRLCGEEYRSIKEKILSEKIVSSLSMKITRGMYTSSTQTLFSQQAIQGDLEEKINGDLFTTLKFWGAVKTKVYLLFIHDVEALQFILFLPSIQFLDELPIIGCPGFKEPERLTSIREYPNIDLPLFVLDDYAMFKYEKKSFNCNDDIRKNMPQWTFLTDQQKEGMYIDILNFRKNIYLIIRVEQKMLNMLVCAGLFQKGILMDFLLRDLYDPRLLITICSF